jgi:hypothetical protein
MSDINLFEQCEFIEDRGIWFPFSDKPEFKGFEIKLKILSPKEANILRRQCIYFKKGKENFDEDKFSELSTREQFIDFRGLTAGMLKMLVPWIKRIKSPDGTKHLKDTDIIPYMPENALFLRYNNVEINDFINEKLLDRENFYKETKEAEAKNSSTSASGSKIMDGER